MRLVAVAVLGVALASSARADDDDGARHLRHGPPAAVPISKIESLVNAEGYPEIRKIKRRGAAYEVQAFDAGGRPTVLQLSASTGQIIAVDALEEDDD